MKYIFFLATTLIAVHCMGQNVPSPVKQAFEKSFPDITLGKWYKAAIKQISFQTAKPCQRLLTQQVTWKRRKPVLKFLNCLHPLLNILKKNYKDAMIKEASIIERGKEKMYEAEVKGKDVLFDMQGKFLKEEKD